MERVLADPDASRAGGATDRGRVARPVDRQLVAAAPPRRQVGLDAGDAEGEGAERPARGEGDAVGHEVVTGGGRGERGAGGRGEPGDSRATARDDHPVLREVDVYLDGRVRASQAAQRDPPVAARPLVRDLHAAPRPAARGALDPGRQAHVVVLRAVRQLADHRRGRPGPRVHRHRGRDAPPAGTAGGAARGRLRSSRRTGSAWVRARSATSRLTVRRCDTAAFATSVRAPRKDAGAGRAPEGQEARHDRRHPEGR